MAMLTSAMCLATAALNSVNVVSAADEKTNVSFLMGDVNEDGSFGISDVVLLQKWLLGVPDTHLANWKAADFCEDNRLDVFDLTLMKRALIEKLNGSPELDDPEVREILFGYPDSGSSASAPMSSIRTALKCKAFCPSDEALCVDVAMLGFYEPEGYDENTFLYDFSICPYTYEESKPIEDKRLIINDKSSNYVKEYVGEDREVFNVGREYNNIDTYHHETASLNFENYSSGSSGKITFIFKAVFLNDDGTLPEQPQSEGFGQTMYYYVGDDGVGISNVSIEDAEESYKNKGSNDVPPLADPITPVNEKQSITFVTYDTYKEFIEQNDLPEGFVDYEQVKEIGSFNSLVFLSDARNADYSEYMYGFTESSKNTVFLTIVPSSKEKTSVISTPLSIDDINQSDMRFTKNKEVSGIFKIDDLSYKYIKGTLLSIMWEKNNLRYTLSCASTFSDYQLNMDSYVSKLLFYKSDVAERDTYSIAGKIFAYEKEGAGGYCTLSFNENGRFLYSPGKLSSYMGGGDWKIDGDTVSLIGMVDKTIYLKITDDTLVYIAESSDEFPYMDIKDGEKFAIYRPEISSDKFQLNSRYSEYGLGNPKVELNLIASELPEFCYVENVRLYDEDDNFIGMMSPAMDADIWSYLVDCNITEECSKTYYTLTKIRCGQKTYLDDVRSEITVNFKVTPAP